MEAILESLQERYSCPVGQILPPIEECLIENSPPMKGMNEEYFIPQQILNLPPSIRKEPDVVSSFSVSSSTSSTLSLKLIGKPKLTFSRAIIQQLVSEHKDYGNTVNAVQKLKTI